MRTRTTSLRTLLAAFLVAGGVGVACSNQTRHSDSTLAQNTTPLGQTHVSKLPSDHSVAPPDAAEALERPIEQARALSPGAQGMPRSPQGNAPTGTATNPSTPAPTPASPNAPQSVPVPNPIPPSTSTPVGSTGSPAGNTPTSTQGPTTDSGERGQAMNGFDPYQARLDGGVGPGPVPRVDAGPTPSPAPTPRTDGGLGGVGGNNDGGLR